ncbi:AAA family ATPase [Sedimentitalea sp. XS_ASV28]|uniref:AAA family ATPase n=1 Tax=Sedimentitalea sp. XS_ASV28 TaxID=3241296 RepID=UPI0035124088
MLEQDLRAYSAAQTLSGPVIFDRGIPDIMGYLNLCGLPVPPHVAASAKAARYNARVFLAPYWDEIFAQDTERKRTRAEAEAS